MVKFGVVVKPKEIERLYCGKLVSENAVSGRFFLSKRVRGGSVFEKGQWHSGVLEWKVDGGKKAQG